MRYFEFNYDAVAAWWKIRALRANPAIELTSSRRKLFSSALEQAQQQFVASSNVGYETRALNLYYGVSQAGRAISSLLTPAGKSPEVSGHGLKLDMSGRLVGNEFFDCKVRGLRSENSSFGRLASIFESDQLIENVTLGQLWHMIPDLYLDYPVGDHIEPRWLEDRIGIDQYTSELQICVKTTEDEASEDADLLRSMYPVLREARLVKRGGGSYSVDDGGARSESTLFEFQRGAAALSRTRRSGLLMPSCPGGGDLDPLLCWWVLLYSLSMVCRYKPVAWTDLLDVGSSEVAVAIEVFLAKAEVVVPHHILRWLREEG